MTLTYKERLNTYRQMSIPEQIDNIVRLGKKLDKQLAKIIKQLDRMEKEL